MIIKKQLCSGKLWNDRGYIGTVGDFQIPILKTMLKAKEIRKKKNQ